MDPNKIIILAIVATSVATFISRFFGAITSEKVDAKSKLFDWFNLVAYSTLAALLGRMIIFPASALQDSSLIIRLIVVSICIAVFIYSKKNLVLVTHKVVISQLLDVGAHPAENIGQRKKTKKNPWETLCSRENMIPCALAHLPPEKNALHHDPCVLQHTAPKQ